MKICMIPHHLCLLLLSFMMPDEDLIGSIPKDIATLKPCVLCDGALFHLKVDQTKDISFHQNGAFGIESFSCAELFLKHQEHPDELLSANACDFLQATCVSCEVWLPEEPVTVP